VRRAIISLWLVGALYGLAAELGSAFLPRRLRVGAHDLEHGALLPTLTALGEELVSLVQSGLLPAGAAASASRVLAGFLLGAAAGIPLGFAMARRPWLGHTLAPWVALLRYTPAIALLPLLVLWLGAGEAATILLIAAAVAVVTREGAAAGVNGVAPVHLDVAAALGASQALVWRRVVLPAALPRLLASVRVAVGLAWVTAVAAELITLQTPSLGSLLAISGAGVRVPTILVALATVGLLALGSDALARAAYRRGTRWMPAG
jgi:NitT/TauT family transport system permease protein